MTTNSYESVVIINASLEDEQIDLIVSKIKETITSNGGDISETDLWGRKRLAYPIKKSKSGYYAIFRFSAPTSSIAKIERMYRLEENIYRYLTIVLDEDALEYIEELKKAPVQTEAVEAAATSDVKNDNQEAETENI